MSRILVISPHPDDEAIGCGGTLHKHVSEGDVVHTIFLTSGEGGGHGRYSTEEMIRIREAEADVSAGVLGIELVEFWREPDGKLRASSRVVERLREKITVWQPEMIYVTHNREEHNDHSAAARLVSRAIGGLPQSAARPLVLMYEVWTPLQRMDLIVDITSHVEAKLAAIRAYRSQCEAMRFDEAALALSRYRGEMHSWPGGPYAEVFRAITF